MHSHLRSTTALVLCFSLLMPSLGQAFPMAGGMELNSSDEDSSGYHKSSISLITSRSKNLKEEKSDEEDSSFRSEEENLILRLTPKRNAHSTLMPLNLNSSDQEDYSEEEEYFEGTSKAQGSHNHPMTPQEYENFRAQADFLFQNNLFHIPQGRRCMEPPSTSERKQIKRDLQLTYNQALQKGLVLPKENFFVLNCQDIYECIERCIGRNEYEQERIRREQQAAAKKNSDIEAKAEAEKLFMSTQAAWEKDLPRDVFLNHLFPYLTDKDLYKLRKVSKLFRALVGSFIFQRILDPLPKEFKKEKEALLDQYTHSTFKRKKVLISAARTLCAYRTNLVPSPVLDFLDLDSRPSALGILNGLLQDLQLTDLFQSHYPRNPFEEEDLWEKVWHPPAEIKPIFPYCNLIYEGEFAEQERAKELFQNLIDINLSPLAFIKGIPLHKRFELFQLLRTLKRTKGADEAINRLPISQKNLAALLLLSPERIGLFFDNRLLGSVSWEKEIYPIIVGKLIDSKFIEEYCIPDHTNRWYDHTSHFKWEVENLVYVLEKPTKKYLLEFGKYSIKLEQTLKGFKTPKIPSSLVIDKKSLLKQWSRAFPMAFSCETLEPKLELFDIIWKIDWENKQKNLRYEYARIEEKSKDKMEKEKTRTRHKLLYPDHPASSSENSD